MLQVSLAWVACRSGLLCGCATVTRAPGNLPVQYLHDHPSMRGGLNASVSNTYPKYVKKGSQISPVDVLIERVSTSYLAAPQRRSSSFDELCSSLMRRSN